MNPLKTPCIPAARVNNNGYGHHRSAYREAFGPIPKGMDVHHTCRNRACLNPYHMELRTRSQNMAEAMPRRWRRVPEELEKACVEFWNQGLSQHEISEATGVTGSSVCKILLGRPYG